MEGKDVHVLSQASCTSCCVLAASDGHTVSCNNCSMLETSMEEGKNVCIYHGVDIFSSLTFVAS